MDALWRISRHPIVVGVVLMAFAALLLPRTADPQGACNPPGAPIGSFGCTPQFPVAQGGDLVPVWRASAFPNSMGMIPLATVTSGVDYTKPPPIGTAVPNTGSFTTLTANTLAVNGGITAPSLPTSCTGLPSGTWWNNGHVVSIC